MIPETKTAAYPEYAMWAEEIAELDALLAKLTPDQWHRVTAFKHWRIFDHVHHLNLSDALAEQAAARPDSFREDRRVMPPGSIGGLGRDGPPDIPPDELLACWRDGARSLGSALAPLDARARLPWFGPEMSVRAFVAARQMETWSHGQTIFDTLGKPREATDRIRPICELGWRTMGWSFAVNGLPAPTQTLHLKLTAPSGATWTWGDATAPDRVSGKACDFALVVCQCRNIADTSLKVEGDVARRWMAIAQCFAGKANPPPRPGQRIPAKQETT